MEIVIIKVDERNNFPTKEQREEMDIPVSTSCAKMSFLFAEIPERVLRALGAYKGDYLAITYEMASVDWDADEAHTDSITIRKVHVPF